MSFNKTYEPAQLEPKWEKLWLESDSFCADESSSNPPFSIVIPPPNVTGSLHLGHALNNTLQDILCRYMRMCGKEVLWMPGTDHAGIATQNVVERQLAAEGSDKYALGREAFVERVWKWKERSGGRIITQLKRLGCSCDWARERFTMDEGLSAAVKEVFVRLYHEGLIYRGDYMINWCPRCESALADLEVEYPAEFEAGFLYRFRYPFVDAKSEDDAIIVDTTRPETMLGDTAVAVHPDDKRYSSIIGRKVRLPLVGREMPVIADSFVDPEFGTGAVKVTPGHDPNDFECGRRHGLEVVSVIGADAKMNDEAGAYAGLDRFECRKKILEDLKAEGVLLGTKDHPMKPGSCYRCHTVTEPLISTQWFMKMADMAAEAADAVRDGRTKIVPKTWEATYFQWLDNIRDWCISRQLWWGHQIPVWYCQDCSALTVAVVPPSACQSCQSENLQQDPDVLDTWFSSALWPFTTMGWPEQTQALKKFYPTSSMITGFDILFFWVARMMMMGLKIMGEIPFHDIYLHAMVRDEHGQKMSKTKGNVIDPLEIIEEHGADALRFTLAILALQGRDVNLSRSRIEGYRNFLNKIWNAVRYVLLNLQGEENEQLEFQVNSSQDVPNDLAGRWIRSRLAKAVVANRNAYEEYQFSEICGANYRFFWDEFCSWYLEISKLQLKDADDAEKQRVLNMLIVGIDVSLRLLSPVVPFITEELWESLPGLNGKPRDTLNKESFPTLAEFGGEVLQVDSQAEEQMALLQEIITVVRTVRSEKNIAPAVPLKLRIEYRSEDEENFISAQTAIISGMARVAEVLAGDKESAGAASTKIVQGLKVHVLLEGAFDKEAEKSRIEKEVKELSGLLKRTEGKLANKSFLDKAPAEVVEKEKNKMAEFQEKLAVLDASAKELGL